MQATIFDEAHITRASGGVWPFPLQNGPPQGVGTKREPGGRVSSPCLKAGVSARLILDELNPELKSHELQADGLYRILLHGQPILLHVEFQKAHDKQMQMHLLEYNVQASRAHQDMPIHSCVIYLVPNNQIPDPPFVQRLPNGDETLCLNYTCMKLWEIPSQDLLTSDSLSLLPLVPLTREGQHLEVIEAMIDRLGPTRNKELVTLAWNIIGLAVHDPTDRRILQGRFHMLDDLLSESWVYNG